MSTNNSNNNEDIELKSTEHKTPEEGNQLVIETQPKTGDNQQKPNKLSSAEELALLGLRPNSAHSDPCLCFCCIFCLEMCLVPTGGAPPMSDEKRLGRKVMGIHNWDNDSYAEHHSDDGYDWAVTFANNITGSNGHHNDYGADTGGDGGADGCDGGGDGGGGGCDGGGGE